MAEASGPNAIILSADSCIKIAKQIQILCLWHLTNKLIAVEPIFNFCFGVEGDLYNCYKVDYAIAGVMVEETTGALYHQWEHLAWEEVTILLQTQLHSRLTILVIISIPEEGVVLLLQ